MKKIGLIVVCLFFNYCQALIVEAPHLKTFEEAVREADQNSFILFDVDDTLIISKDLILRECTRDIWHEFAKETIKNPTISITKEYNEEYFLGEVYSKMEFELIDPKVINIIKSLQKKKIKTIAFTRMHTGPYGPMTSIEDWRIEHLRHFGLIFESAFPQFPLLKIDVEKASKPALFKKGVLFADKQEKGPVLVAFLKAIGWKPSKIFMLDDRMSFLQSIESSLEGTGMQFLGFHYTEMKNRPCLLDLRLAKFQLHHLATTGKWLSDTEAAKQKELLQANQ